MSMVGCKKETQLRVSGLVYMARLARRLGQDAKAVQYFDRAKRICAEFKVKVVL